MQCITLVHMLEVPDLYDRWFIYPQNSPLVLLQLTLATTTRQQRKETKLQPN